MIPLWPPGRMGGWFRRIPVMARPQFGQPFSPQRPFPLHNKSKVFDRNNNTSGSRFAIPFLLRKSLSQQSRVQKLAQPAWWKSSKQRPQINLTFYISYLVESRSFCVARNQFCCSGWWWWTSWTLRQRGVDHLENRDYGTAWPFFLSLLPCVLSLSIFSGMVSPRWVVFTCVLRGGLRVSLQYFIFYLVEQYV